MDSRLRGNDIRDEGMTNGICRNNEIATLSSKVRNDTIRDCRAPKAVLAMTKWDDEIAASLRSSQ